MTRILILSVSLWLFTACSDQQGSAETNSVTESTEEQMGTVVESELTADVITEPQPIIEYCRGFMFRPCCRGVKSLLHILSAATGRPSSLPLPA